MRKNILILILLSSFNLCANAYDIYHVPNEGASVYQFNVLSPGEYIYAAGEQITPDFVIPQDYIYPILKSAEFWNEKIELQASARTPIIYYYTNENEYNAFSGSPFVLVEGQPYKYNIVSAKFHGWNYTPLPPEEITGDAIIMVGLGISEDFPGWQPYTGKHSLYHGELPDLFSVMNHEIMHSLGISSAADQYHAVGGDPTSDQKYYFSESVTDPISFFDSQIRIYTGNSNPITDSTNEIAPAPGQAIGFEEGEYNVVGNSPYFVGENTIKVLGGNNDYDIARQNIVDNGGLKNYSDAYYNEDSPSSTAYPTVFGMPIHPMDSSSDYDLSHLELRNSYMSHQDYRNWLTPMEAELAVLKDLGYNIDLHKYYGKSYYLNNNITTYSAGFSEWNGTSYTGNPSKIDQTVGIHIYGDNNDITQTTNSIETIGEGSIGVRIDGIENTFTLADTDIHTNGKNNIGIAVTYGRGHYVNVNNGTEVTAKGENGIATSFDFGANLFGTADSNIKGSYINYISGHDAPNVDNANIGALVKEFNVNGTLTGSKAAIYISDNAYVENINIGDGAKINGDIISEWNSKLSLGKARVHTASTQYTNLKFNAPAGVDINGNITGKNEVCNTLKMNNAEASVINFNGNEINVDSLDNNGNINISNNALITTVGGEITGNGNINVLTGAGLSLPSNIANIENTVNLNSATLDVANNSVSSTTFSTLTLSGSNSIKVDADVAAQTSDILNFNNSADLIVNPGANIEISKVNLINANKTYTNKKYYMPFISEEYNNQNLLGAVTLADKQTIMTPIFKYNLDYTEDMTLRQGGFLFSRGNTRNYNSYNPAVMASPIAAQVGGYLTQLNSYDEAFRNMDMYMLMTQKERQALKLRNKIASVEGGNIAFDPAIRQEEKAGGWFRPYATFEKVNLHNGPKVENTAYGSFFGGESEMKDLGHGWDGMWGAYIGYNGSHQNYDGIRIYQNGGTLGLVGMAYKDNFFLGGTINTGASAGEASTMYGNDNFAMLMAGIAAKTGYNWELADGKFIIQPNILLAYSFVNTFDYTNSAGVRIDSDPLNAITIEPGIKFIGNLRNGWQPYAGVSVIINAMDKANFNANDVTLPSLSVNPYVKYGLGVRKTWGERLTGFFQSFITNGGRNGVGLSLGFRWAIGK